MDGSTPHPATLEPPNPNPAVSTDALDLDELMGAAQDGAAPPGGGMPPGPGVDLSVFDPKVLEPLCRLPFQLWLPPDLNRAEADALSQCVTTVVVKWFPLLSEKWAEELALALVLMPIVISRLGKPSDTSPDKGETVLEGTDLSTGRDIAGVSPPAGPPPPVPTGPEAVIEPTPSPQSDHRRVRPEGNGQDLPAQGDGGETAQGDHPG